MANCDECDKIDGVLTCFVPSTGFITNGTIILAEFDSPCPSDDQFKYLKQFDENIQPPEL